MAPVEPRCPVPQSGPSAVGDCAIDERLVRFVWKTLRRLGVPVRGLEDATQEVFLIALRKLGEFEGRSSLRTWLFGIALHVAQRSVGAARRDRSEPLPDALVDVAGLSQEQAVARREAVETLYAALDQLDHEQRVVFVLAELEELTAPEIAQITGAALGTVYSRLRAARRTFDRALRWHGARDGRRNR
jgi:RNA polymerase sigma-70 factor (ECF subfamily)